MGGGAFSMGPGSTRGATPSPGRFAARAGVGRATSPGRRGDEPGFAGVGAFGRSPPFQGWVRAHGLEVAVGGLVPLGQRLGGGARTPRF